MAELTREQLLKQMTPKREKVLAPDFGADCYVYVRQLRGVERAKFDLVATDDNGRFTPMARAWMAVFSVVNEDGTNKFTETDIPSLNDQYGNFLQDVWLAGYRLNLRGAVAEEEAKKN